MLSLTVTRVINAPAETVFARCSGFADAPRHVSAIKKVEMLTPGPVGKGTKFKETRVMFGKEATETLEVVEWDPSRSFTVGGLSCGTVFRTRFDFQPQAANTLVTLQFDATPTSLFAKIMSPLAFLMMGAMKKCVEGDLNDIAKAIESGGVR